MKALRQRLVALIPSPRYAASPARGPRPCRFCGRIGLHDIGCSRLDRLDAGETS